MGAGISFGGRDYNAAAGFLKLGNDIDPETSDEQRYRGHYRCAVLNSEFYAANQIARWWTVSIGSDKAFQALCDAAGYRSNGNSLVDAIQRSMARGFNPFSRQVSFALLSRYLTEFSGSGDPEAGAAICSRLAAEAVFREAFRLANARRPEVLAALRTVSSSISNPDLREGLLSFVEDNPASAIEGYIRFGRCGRTDAARYARGSRLGTSRRPSVVASGKSLFRYVVGCREADAQHTGNTIQRLRRDGTQSSRIRSIPTGSPNICRRAMFSCGCWAASTLPARGSLM